MSFTHHQLKLMINAYVDNELSEQEGKTIESHLQLCKECSEELQSLRKWKSLAAAQPPFEVNPYFLTRMKARIHEQTTNVWQPFIDEAKRLLPLFSIIVLALMLYFVVGREEKIVTMEDYFLGGRRTIIDQKVLGNNSFSKDEVLALSVSSTRGEERKEK